MNISTLITRDKFVTAVAAAKPGDTITYHIGSLMQDRQYGQNFLAVHGVALAAWAAMEEGKVALTQRKIGGTTAYLARALPPPHRRVEWHGAYNPDRFHIQKRAA